MNKKSGNNSGGGVVLTPYQMVISTPTIVNSGHTININITIQPRYNVQSVTLDFDYTGSLGDKTIEMYVMDDRMRLKKVEVTYDTWDDNKIKHIEYN